MMFKSPKTSAADSDAIQRLDIAEIPHRLAKQEIAPNDKGKEDVAKDDD